ncbi:MAG: VCBS repeat-containing protein [Archangium sp.]
MRLVVVLLLSLASAARAAADCPTLQFEPWLTFDDHDLVQDVRSVDLNRDGRLDFVVSESNYDFVSVFINTGNGFDELHHVPTGEQPYPLSFADVDGDGQLDICTGGGDRSLAILFARDGGFSFSAPTVVPDAGEAAIVGLVVSDFDGDGHVDSSAGGNFANTLTLLHGQSSTTFTPWMVFDAGTPIGPAARADLNRDGLEDAVFTSYFFGVSVLLSQRGATPAFSQYRSALPSNHDMVLVADLDADGRLDIAQAGYQGVASYLQNVDGTFTPSVAVMGEPTELFGLASGDFDGDGRADLVASDVQTRVRFFLNEPTGFTTAGEIPSLAQPLRLATGDFDGDGRVDVVLSTYASSKILVFRNVTACARVSDGGVVGTTDGGAGVRWYPVGCTCSHGDASLLWFALLLLRARRRVA